MSVLFARRGWPLTSTASESCELKNCECSRCGRVDPGTVISRLWKLRLKVSGMSRHHLRFDDAAGVGPVGLQQRRLGRRRVTASVIWPTSSFMSTRIVVLTSTLTPWRTTFLKPCSSASTVYVPFSRLEKV